MTAAALAGPHAVPERADWRTWLGVSAATIGGLMALLDISIVNASLPTIQGEIGATTTEASWVATSYLVAEIIVIPLSGWMMQLLGLRNLLVTACGLFTLFSVVCGSADNLTMMVLGRTGQGLTGGMLIPLSLTVIATLLPPAQQSIGMAIFGVVAVMGPILGPILGGWLTESFSWHYAFLINVPVAAVMITMLMIGLPPARARFALLREADWLGIAGLALGLGAMTVVLEEGHRELWFESSLIVTLTLASVLGFAMVAAGQIFAARPVLKLRLVGDRHFAVVTFLSAVNGLGFIVPPFLLPQFLARLAHYNALQAGLAMFPLGVASCMTMPVMLMLMPRLDIRVMLAVGLAALGTASLLNTGFTSATTGGDLLLAQIVYGFGISATFFNLNQANVSLVSQADLPDASGIFNGVRNLAGSMGLAVMVTVQDQRLDYHHQTLATAVTANSGAVRDQLAGMAALVDGGAGNGAARALRLLDARIVDQAAVLAYNDVFLILAILAFAAIPLVPLIGRIRTDGVAAMH